MFCRYFKKLLSPTLPKLMNWILLSPPPLSLRPRQPQNLERAPYTKLFRTPYYLINNWLYKPRVLQGIRDTLQGHRKHKVCKKSFVWLPWQLFDNMVLYTNNCQNEYEEQRYFSNAPRNHKLEGVKIKICVMIVLFWQFRKSNFKVDGSARFLGGTGGIMGLNVEE